MTQFGLEFFNYIASILGILVSLSSAILFYITQRVESSMKTFWRAFGFAALSFAIILSLLERKFPDMALTALLIELVGFASIFRGVLSEPTLTHLRQVKEDSTKKLEDFSKSRKEKIRKIFLISSAALFIIATMATLIYFNDLILEKVSFGPYLAPGLITLSSIFIACTIFLQVKRYFTEGGNIRTKLLNLWPLIAYVFLLIRGILLVLYRLPETDILFLHKMKTVFSVPWQISILMSLLGFIFLGLWVWEFIKPRFFLRTYVTFLAIASIVSSLGSLIFTLLIFRIVEQDNLELMTEGAQAQYLVMEDRSRTALILARSIASDINISDGKIADDYSAIYDRTETQLLATGTDVLRVFDANGNVVVSPSDIRDQNLSFEDDQILQQVLENNQPVKTFGVESHVLSPVLIARGIYPIMSGNNLVGAVEVGYKMDTAFVDFSKDLTDLDVTIYTDKNRSATTLYKEDGVSRWVGSNETNEVVLENVLKDGESQSLALDRLGIDFYSAFVPIRDFNGKIIGMVSVGSPTYELFESSRQQLLTAFLILTLVSIVAAMIGYFALQSSKSMVKEI
ncbi:cache domain-containing protein [Candidatus Dojkabacteria bacterium]|nr:cache domain-containing protein [Candidatus Dojkabacteria bacterium]